MTILRFSMQRGGDIIQHTILEIWFGYFPRVFIWTSNMIKKITWFVTRLKMIFIVTNSNCLAQYQLQTTSIISPTLSVNPSLFAIPCIFYGDYRFTALQLLSHTIVEFSSKFDHPWQYFITSWWEEKVGVWTTDELIHHPWQYSLTCT